MSIGSKIAKLRLQSRFSQEFLAQLLNVSHEDVCKWETGQRTPDINMLPTLADIFEISIDDLFDRKPDRADMISMQKSLSWSDDGALRVVLYRGHQLLESSQNTADLIFKYEGYVENIYSAISVSCGNVNGDVEAGSFVSCGNIEGNVTAGYHIQCGNVQGDIEAGSHVQCGDVSGNIEAGKNVKCGNVVGDIRAGGDVKRNVAQG